MKRGTMLVFDKQIKGTIAYYSEAEFYDFLGAFDKYAFHLHASPSNAGPPNVTLTLEHGSDKQNFAAKNASPEISTQALDASNEKHIMGYDAGTVVGQAYGRIKITCSADPGCRIRVWATGRDS